VEVLRKRDAAQWFRESLKSADGAATDPFESIPGWRGYHRIRKRDDGACGFLSERNLCRLHEELGEGRKPLTCRMFPHHFHPAPDAVIVTTSFGCPTVVANLGAPIATGAPLAALTKLRTEWSATHPPTATPRQLVRGRIIEAGSLSILRDALLIMLNRADGGVLDLRRNLRRMAVMLDDLTRARVRRLPDADFAEYVRLTVPFAAATNQEVPARPPTRLGRLLQRGFLFAVAATRLRLEYGQGPRVALRLKTLWLLAHLHGLAPPAGRVNVAALRRAGVDLNAPEVQPVALHYLRASFQSLGASGRPVLDELAIAVSYLNAACSLAVMNGEGGTFSEALMEAVDLSHGDARGLLGPALCRFAAGTEAFYTQTDRAS
jgi:hypothetical protein